MYNTDNKLEFLSTYSPDTEEIYSYTFRAIAPIEKELGKDLLHFSRKEIEYAFEKIKYSSISTLKSNVYCIKAYIEFGINKGNRKDKKNPLMHIPNEWLKQFVSPTEYFSQNEFQEIVDNCINEQDAVVLQLFFEGVDSNEEMLNITVDHVNRIDPIKRELVLINEEDNTRTITISEKCLNLLKAAIDQKDYWKKNGSAKAKNPFSEMVFGEYAIRLVMTRNTEIRDTHMIYRKLDMLREVLNKPNLDRRNIRSSGMIYRAVQIYKQKVEINRDIRFQIADEFGIKRTSASGRKNHDDSRLKEFINPEVIETLYGIDIRPHNDFELVDENDKEKTNYEQTKRTNQAGFKLEMLMIYNNRCAITGETTTETLQAAHIQPYINKKSNHHQNGILLRSDLHLLFDKGFITIDEDYRVKVHFDLVSDYYKQFDGQMIFLPDNKRDHPSKVAIRRHHEKVFNMETTSVNI